MADRIRHQAIAASAGSGKTYALAHRYIGLLALGVPPERIVALTFSRKAAGEIFDSIAGYLVAAAGDEAAADAMGRQLGMALSRSHALGLLRNLLQSQSEPQIGTLDSFAVRLLKTFAAELGAVMGFEVMDTDGPRAAQLRRQVLGELLMTGGVSEASRREFTNAFRLATFGQQERRLTETLDRFIRDSHMLYQSWPDQEIWGFAGLLGLAAGWRANIEPGPLVAELEEDFVARLDPRQQQRWQDFLAAVPAFAPEAPLSNKLMFLWKKLLPQVARLGTEEVEIRFDRRSCVIPAAAGRRILSLMRWICSRELVACCAQAKGMANLLGLYERLYDRQVRRQGQLTFADVLNYLDPFHARRLFSTTPGEGRLYLDYRLDHSLDHWLLDEFQDTSSQQWRVLANPISEVIQDPSGNRSFFYVGDVKQAIYGWRGGNADLFNAILERYGPVIEQGALDCSYRSCRPLIAMINRVFSGLPDELPEAARRQWEKIWRRHASASMLADRSGVAVLLEPPLPDDGKPTAADRYRIVADLLQEIDPVARGLSAAILVRTNQQGRRVRAVLQELCPHIEVVHEGITSIVDTPAVALLLSLLRYAAHPGDRFCARHLAMSPLATVIDGLGGMARLPGLLSGQVQQMGFAGTLRWWCRHLGKEVNFAAGTEKRLAELIGAATQYDRQGDRAMADFVQAMAQHQIREQAGAGVVRVMTIHQAKGLGFDLVILPDLQDGALGGGSRRSLLEFYDQQGDCQAIIKRPRQEIGALDPAVAACFERDRVEGVFDALCVLYVAMTRARYGLYCISSYQGKSSASLTAAAMIKEIYTGRRQPTTGSTRRLNGRQVTVLGQEGEWQWYTGYAVSDRQPVPIPPITLANRFLHRARTRQRGHLAPSAAGRQSVAAGSLFAAEQNRGLAFGTAIHALFEKVSFSGDQALEQVCAAWRAEGRWPPEIAQPVEEQFRAAMATPEVQKALARPSGRVVLWREREFDVLVGKRWVSGIFDRVVLLLDETAAPRAATIVDYKSNRINSEAELRAACDHYRPQLTLYQQALAALTGIAPRAIRLQLLFTAVGRLLEL